MFQRIETKTQFSTTHTPLMLFEELTVFLNDSLLNIVCVIYSILANIQTNELLITGVQTWTIIDLPYNQY